MKEELIIDTNVAILANGKSKFPAKCIYECIQTIRGITKRNHAIIVTDREGFIFNEYKKYLNLSGEPGLGDEFLKWLDENRWTEDLCRIIDLNVSSEDEFCQGIIPDAICQSSFDPSDRKFLAVSIKHPESPQIVEATDVKWKLHESLLNHHGISVRFICPEYVEGQIAKKHS